MPQPRFARFAIALPLYRVFEYALAEGDKALPGTRYRLPFGNRSCTGILLDSDRASEFEPSKIKPVEQRLDDEAVIDAHMLELARWIAEYYLQPLGEVLFLCLPGYLRGARTQASTRVKRWKLGPAASDDPESLLRRSPRQLEIVQALAAEPRGLTALDFKVINPDWHAPVARLEQKNLIRFEWSEPESAPLPSPILPELSHEQRQILERIEPQLETFGAHLLDGITGSGKTEVYLRLIRNRLDAGRQVIYLVPEIGLTSQLIERIGERFGEAYAISHSGLSDLQRYRAWERFRRGEAGIMLGTRSSLFAQSSRLGLIVIDEEHDHSYRQEDGVRYHARDVAIKRAQMLNIPVLLGSATPSLESLNNLGRDHYHRYRLDARPTAFAPPPLELVDISKSRLDSGCAAATLERIGQHLERRGQVLIYLNRRGYAPIVLCHECGWQAHCLNCDARLTLHQSVSSLICHHCGFNRGLPEACPECGQVEIRHYGIGTEQLEQGLGQRFPEVPVLRIDRDVIASREALKQRLQTLAGGEPCILVGTQMIAKGHDYPAISLAVVLDADQALFSASYRASERLAQTLFQVAGRSGRGDREGEALVQTRFPQHPLMQALRRKTYRDIAAGLLQERQSYGFPPFARAVMFRADAVELEQAMRLLEKIRDELAAAREYSRLSCIGPLPALMTRRIGRYRAQLCLLAVDFRVLRSVLNDAMPAIETLAGGGRASWSVDVDAYDL